MSYRSKGVLRGLADTRFEHMVTPALVGWLYLAAAAWISGCALLAVLWMWWLAGWAGWGWWLLLPVIAAGGLIGLLVARVACEWLLMAFTRGRSLSHTPHPNSSRPDRRDGRDEQDERAEWPKGERRQ